MRVLMVSEDIPRPQLGGLGRHVVVLANALQDAGHDVTLMGCMQPRYEDCAEEVGFTGPFLPALAGLEAGWKELATGCFNPLKREVMAAKIAREIRAVADQFDVVHYHGHYPMVNRFLPSRLPFVQTRHDQGSECLTHVRLKAGRVCKALNEDACASCVHPAPGPLRTAVSAVAVRRYRRQAAEAFERHPVIFVSDFLRQQFLKAVPAANLERSHVVHAFINEAQTVRMEDQAAPQRVVVHVAGRLAATKGIVEFVRLLKPQLPSNWLLNVYGDGPQRAEMEALVGSQVVWHGHQSTANVMAACSESSVAVVPSLCEEAWGAVTAEALRAGVPCYALAMGGTPELTRYGAPGQLRLFTDLPALVRGLTSEPIPPRRFGGVAADVHARLPEILAIYQAITQVRAAS